MTQETGQRREVLLGRRITGAYLEDSPKWYRANFLPERLRQSTPAAKFAGVIVADFGLGLPPLWPVTGANKVHGDNLLVLELTECILFDDFRIAVGVGFTEAIANVESIRDRIHPLIQDLQSVRFPKPVNEPPGYGRRTLMLLRSGRHEGPQAGFGLKTRLEPLGISVGERGDEFPTNGRHYGGNRPP
jgi:hypothetical protein